MTTLATRARAASPWLMVTMLTTSGVLHLTRPQLFDSLVPRSLPFRRAFVHATGVAELVVAAAVARPSTREHGGLGAAALMVAVFPANVSQALHPGDVPRWQAVLRLPLQVPLVLWGRQIQRDARRGR